MMIILIIMSTLAGLVSAAMSWIAFLMLNGGGLGRSSPVDVSFLAGYALLNIAVVGSLLSWGSRWKPVFYVLGIIDCLLGASLIFTQAALLGVIYYTKGALVLSCASRMTQFPIR